jgi:sugar-phosphatase
MRAVLFDVDGVLLDSSATHQAIWSQWCSENDLDIDAVWPLTHARRPVDTLREVLTTDADPGPALSRLGELAAAAAARHDGFPAFPGASRLLNQLAPACWAVVTSGYADRVTDRFIRAGLPVPTVLIDGAAVVEAKPSPEGYLAAAQRLGAHPSECLVIEDAPAGVAAGAAAGMTVIAITTTHVADELTAAHYTVQTLDQAAEVIHQLLVT